MDLLRLILLDDEPIILEGLQHTYSWEEMGFLVVGAYLCAEDALEDFYEVRPQVVMTDIRMKDISGIDFMKQVKEMSEDCLVVLISAFRDFEYAKAACDYGAFSYLLKPFTDEQLSQTMKKVYHTYTENLKIKEEQKELKEVLLHSDNSFLNIAIERFLRGSINIEDIEKVLRLSDKKQTEDCTYVSVIADVDLIYRITNEMEYEIQRYNLFQQITDMLEQDYKVWKLQQENGSMAFIINTSHRPGIISIKKSIATIRSDFQSEIVSAISSEMTGTVGIKKSFEQAKKLFEVAGESGAGILVHTEEETNTPQETYSVNAEQYILNAIRKNDLHDLKQAMVQFVYSLPKEESDIKKYIQRLALKVDFYLSETYGLTDKITKSFTFLYKTLYDLKQGKAIDVLYKLLIQIIEEREASFQSHTAQYFRAYMEQALVYIKEHLQEEDLAITTVASEVYLNPAYFGRVFKKTMGISFRRYLLNQRMDRAKQLLEEGNDSIIEVCEKVGIGNPSYFAQTFKQYTRYLPSEYAGQAYEMEKH